MFRSIAAPTCAVLICCALLAGCDSGPQATEETRPVAKSQPQPAPRPQVRLPEKRTADARLNLVLLDSILKEYRKNHTYMGNDLYDCEDMAMDVWNIVRTKGFNAKIAIGNNEKNIMTTLETFLTEVSHSWVMAEYDTGQWMAMECTGGYLVPEDKAPHYYDSAIFLPSPAEVRDYNNYAEAANKTCDEFNSLARGWNKAVAGKVSANNQTINQVKGYMQAKEKECDGYRTKLKYMVLTMRKL